MWGFLITSLGLLGLRGISGGGSALDNSGGHALFGSCHAIFGLAGLSASLDVPAASTDDLSQCLDALGTAAQA